MRAAIFAIAISLAACAAAARPPAVAASAGPLQAADVDAALAFAALQLQRAVEDFPPGSGTFPGRNTNPDGSWPAVEATNWVAGFLPGSLWQLHALTGQRRWRDAATALLPGLDPVKDYTGSHDVGFIIGSSFGLALEAKPPPPDPAARRYRAVMRRAAASLAKRYSPKLGLLRSWGKDLDGREFKVIVDNMMNLQLLFTAAALPGGRREWRDMAVSHARRTARDFLREDASTYHLVVYDAVTGAVRWKGTHQGWSNSSTWARGQAWALHGFTQAFEATGQPLLRRAALRAADRFLEALPADWVPVWDFDAPKGQRWKDTSAGSIAATGLLRLARATRTPRYRTAALRMLSALCRGYLAAAAPQYRHLASVLRNGTYSRQLAGVGLPFGDFYLLSALADLKKHGAQAGA